MSELVNDLLLLANIGQMLRTWSEKLAILKKYDCNENGIYDDKIIKRILSDYKSINDIDIMKYNSERFYSSGNNVA